MQTPAELIAETESAWANLMGIIDDVPAERLTESGACGRWSVKDIIGHLAFWDGFEADHVADRQAGLEVDWQRLNDEAEAMNAERPVVDLKAAMAANHTRLMAMLRADPDLDISTWRTLTHDHYAEHIAELRQWLAG